MALTAASSCAQAAGAHGETAGDSLSFAGFYAVMAPMLQASNDQEAFRSLGGDPTAAAAAGAIGVDHLAKELCALMGPGFKPQEAEKIFKESDIDGDSKISYDEFQKVMKEELPALAAKQA